MPGQVGRRRGERLDAGFLVVGHDGDVWLVAAGLAQRRHLAINARHLGHLLGKVRVAPLQAIADLVRLDGLPAEDLAQELRGHLT